VLDALLTKYADEGVLSLDDANVLRVTPFTSMGSVMELVRAFGGKQGFEQAVHEMQTEIYKDTA
jgi:type I restriction enzyme R subunit